MPTPLLLHHLGNCWSNKYHSKIFHNMSHSITMANIPRKECKYCKMLYFLLSFCPPIDKSEQNWVATSPFITDLDLNFWFCGEQWFLLLISNNLLFWWCSIPHERSNLPPPEFGYSQTRKSFENPSLKRLTLKSLSRWKTCNVNSQCTLKILR